MRFFIVIMIAMLSASAVYADEVNRINKRANRLYDDSKFEEALKLYDEAIMLDPSDSRLKMNRGSTLYRMGELDEAEKSYTDALAIPRNKKTTADAHYNLGNILYRQGERLEREGNTQGAREKYTQAMENYANTLRLRPSDRDAKWNLQLAHQKAAMLEGQEDQNQDQNQENQDGDKSDEKQDQDQNQEQDNNDESDSDNEDDQQNRQPQDQEQDQEQDEHDIEKEQAARLIEQYADDSDSLNRPPVRRGRVRQPERDW